MEPDTPSSLPRPPPSIEKAELKSCTPDDPTNMKQDSELGQVYRKATLLDKCREWIRKVGAEESGIERVPEDERTQQKPWSLMLLFFTGNFSTATLALGYLGPTVFGLGWWDSFLTILFFNLLGAVFPAMITPFGHRLGLRTLTVPRYSFGWYPAKILAVLNIITQIGWSIVNDLSGAEILLDVGSGKLPLAVCVLLIGLVAVVISIFGYKYIHVYEQYSWILMLICFAILAGFGAPHFLNVPMGSGSAEAASVLSFGTAIIGYEIAWVMLAADYNVYMREDKSDWEVMGYSFGGLFIGQFSVELLGAALGTLVMSPEVRFQQAYETAGIGGLIGESFSGHGVAVRGLGKFVEAVLSFSTSATICLGMYSTGLSAQLVSRKALKIPRLVFTLLAGAIFLVCAIAGRDHFEAVMTNFLNMIAYYITPVTTIILLEHYIWRRGYSYNLVSWNDKTNLPKGIAALVAFLVGTVVALLCMVQEWWTGPIAEAVGSGNGGIDISWMLAAVASAVIYVPLRYLERKRWGL